MNFAPIFQYIGKVHPNTQVQHPSIYYPNPFSPHGGAKEWCSNELIMHDVDLRRLARVRPLDCGLYDVNVMNQQGQL